MLIYKNFNDNEIKMMISSQEYIKVDINKDIFVAGIEKGIEILNIETEGLNVKTSPKLILYLNYEEIDELYCYMSQLYNFHKLQPNIQLILLFDNSIMFPLNIGMNIIYLPDNVFSKKGVGFYPIKSSVISTKGFEWDVSNLYV